MSTRNTATARKEPKMEGMKTVRVLQGHSICYGGVWFNQGDRLEVPYSTEFATNRAKYDAEGKRLGDEAISQVETISTAPEAHKEEG